MTIRLRIRTPRGQVLDRRVHSLTAEDLDGWFGIRPGRADLVAALRPGLLTYTDELGDGFVAIDGGLLDLQRDDCRVMTREALESRELSSLSERLDTHLSSRTSRRDRHRGVIDELAREALRRMISEVRE